MESLKRDAHDRLKIGTQKPEVVRFYAERGIPLTFLPVGDKYEATGTIYTSGCAPFGCGTDDALIGMRVEVNKEGTVTGEPYVGGIYTNCL